MAGNLPAHVDAYLAAGCGRCARWNTSECSVHIWPETLRALRGLLLEVGLEETIRWGVPCYRAHGKNVILLSALQNACTLSFLNGAHLTDPHRILERPGPNAHIDRMLRFTSPEDVHARADILRAYFREAIAMVEAGIPKKSAPPPMEIPEALESAFARHPELEAAFASLTPGRQRSHLLYISQAKQAATQATRVERCIPYILAGQSVEEGRRGLGNGDGGDYGDAGSRAI